MPDRDLTKLVEALRRADAYACPPGGEITVVQTHISVLFFTESRVYKIKKPVKFDFLDYSTLERRRHFCEEEVRLNRRLAPEIYLGVVSITEDCDHGIQIGGSGKTIEYAVEMIRLPDNRMMSAVLDRGEIDNQTIDDLVRRLARFHQAAATGPGVDEHGAPAEIARQVEENLHSLEQFLIDDVGSHADDGGTISRTVLEHLETTTGQRQEALRDVMTRRVQEGRIREGHGDLHTGNICLLPDATVIYDCIEFSLRFRCRDVAGDLAFLAMDLDLNGFRGFARYLLHHYASLTDDPALPALADFYKLHLATVRGKVASIRSVDPVLGPEERKAGRTEAMRYFHLAAAYTLPPCLILMCGLPGTGKSHAARAIAGPFEAAILRSDVVRKELSPHGTAATNALEAGLYAPEATRRTYDALCTRAAKRLQHERTVVVDATFPTAALRAPFLAMATDLGVPLILVEMTCPADVVRARLERRGRDGMDASDADWRVYEHARKNFEPPREWPLSRHVRIDSRQSPEMIVGDVLAGLIRAT